MRVDAHAARQGCVGPADRALVKGARSVYQVSCTVPTILGDISVPLRLGEASRRTTTDPDS